MLEHVCIAVMRWRIGEVVSVVLEFGAPGSRALNTS